MSRQTTLFELHHIIQISMGWENYHLYEFMCNGRRIGEPSEAFEEFGFGGEKLLDATDVRLEYIVSEAKEKFTYEYDFGDGWRHTIAVEQFLPRDKKTNYPSCTARKLNCPPEDCGGIPGFYALLDVLADKRHPERKAMLEWLGGSYDPESFDKEATNQRLNHLAEYIKDWRSEQ